MGTGVLRLLGGEVENRYVRRGRTSYSVIGEAIMFRPQSASEHAIPTSRQNLPQIQYLNPNGCILSRMRVLLPAKNIQTGYSAPPSYVLNCNMAQLLGVTFQESYNFSQLDSLPQEHSWTNLPPETVLCKEGLKVHWCWMHVIV